MTWPWWAVALMIIPWTMLALVVWYFIHFWWGIIKAWRD